MLHSWLVLKMARTKGSYQKRTFLDTNLGRYIFLHDEISFSIICPNLDVGFEPKVELLLLVCNATKNPSFKNKRFSNYLEQYKKNGLRVERKKPITPSIVEHYQKIKTRRVKNTIKELSKK